MARGIGGDDGPTIFMFVAVLLIWNKVSSLATKGKDAVNDELAKDHADIFQKETTAELTAMHKMVAAIAVPWSQLPKTKGHYQDIADTCWNELSSTLYTSEKKMFDLLTPLKANELKAVAKLFGVRETSLLGLTMSSQTIFTAFEVVLGSTFWGDDLARMRKLWAKTGLWN